MTNRNYTPDSIKDQEADMIARCFLMPEKSFEDMLKSIKDKCDKFKSSESYELMITTLLARRFHVSRKNAAKRSCI